MIQPIVMAIDTSALKDAGVNTLVGMTTVFIILIFISLVISLFGLIPKVQKMFEKKKEEDNTSAMAINNTVELIISTEQANEEDDLELVAVITSAIMAYLDDEAPEDGLVVRSIRRR